MHRRDIGNIIGLKGFLIPQYMYISMYISEKVKPLCCTNIFLI